MDSSKTSLDDIQKWAQAKSYSKIIGALTDSNPAIRIAAVKALSSMNDDLQIPRAVRSGTVDSLILVLNDQHAAVVVEVAKVLGIFHDPRAIEPIIDALANVKDAEIRQIMIEEGIGRIVEINDRDAQSERCTLILQSLMKKPKLSSNIIDSLLYQVAHTYINGGPGWHSEESALGDAIASFGPTAAKQLVRHAEVILVTISYPWEIQKSAQRAKEFGEKILAGEECGSNHQVGPTCVCTKCGKTVHDLNPNCKCKRCKAEDLHRWDERENIYFYQCRHCGKIRYMNATD